MEGMVREGGTGGVSMVPQEIIIKSSTGCVVF